MAKVDLHRFNRPTWNSNLRRNIKTNVRPRFYQLPMWWLGTWSLPRPTHKGLKLPKRFTNLPLDSSGCLGEKGRACIKRNKILNIHDPIKISYFLPVLPFSPWDSKFKPMSENTQFFEFFWWISSYVLIEPFYIYVDVFCTHLFLHTVKSKAAGDLAGNFFFLFLWNVSPAKSVVRVGKRQI